MNTHEIEPITLLRTRLEELDLAIPEGPEKAFITNVAHTIQSKLGATFLKKYRLDSDFVCFRHATIVIDQSRDLKQIQGGVMLLSLSSWVIMVSVNREDWNCNIDILILVINMIKWTGRLLVTIE
jgi:hypothetical protein